MTKLRRQMRHVPFGQLFINKLVIVALGLLLGVALAQAGQDRVLKLFGDLQNVIISVSDRIKPSVVHIEVVQKFDNNKFETLGSGLIVDERGYILTNEHVVDNAQSVTVTLPSKREYPAEVVGVDKQTDLALLKIDAPEKLTAAPLGNSDDVQVGEWVIAVGNPYGFDRTVSFGVVSGKGRVLPRLSMDMPLINNFIQTDAAIDPGSSGGPLVNLQGEVVGINSMGVGRGQGFTIPINIAREVKNKILTSGVIERGWIGIVMQPFPRDFARYFSQPDLEGILVSDVLENSPAAGAGLKPGDVITRFNGREVSAEKDEDLNSFSLTVTQTNIGDRIPVSVSRAGKPVELSITIGTQPKVKAEEFETGLGFTVKEITESIFLQSGLADKDGVLVSYVEVGGEASKAQLGEGDVVHSVEGETVADLAGFKATLAKVKEKPQILLTVKRGKNNRYIILNHSPARGVGQTPELPQN